MAYLVETSGIALLTAGMVTLAYAVYLEMIRAIPVWWWDRTLVLAPSGLVGILGGLALVLRNSG